MGMKYRTTLTAKADLINPKSEDFKAIASSIKDRYGFDLKPQMDLLYVRSCLVSAGPTAGVNDNDDIFTREEVWAARHTPVLKPFNWQHNDKDILGVIYTVQARDLEGNVLNINESTPPDCDFDLWVEAAIFSLVHQDRAQEIQSRSKAGSLFVSMEAWFDDYSYGLCNNNNGHLGKILARNQNTSFLDTHLRASGGAGVYRDPESNQEMRIGRVLRSITFGGCGFVDRPANKRSLIEAVEPMNSLAERDSESQIENLFKKVLESQLLEENYMTNQSNSVNPETVGAAIESALDKREKAAAEKREQEALITRANQAEKLSKEMQEKVDELSKAKEIRDAEVKALQSQIDQYGQAVDKLVRETVAGATSDTPAEISLIDSAKDGETAFQAKISWIEKSLANLRERAARAEELEAGLQEAQLVIREQEVRGLLGDVVSEEALETFITHANSLDEESYSHWRDEKELMVLEFSSAAKYSMKEEMMMKKKKGEKMMKEEKKGCANLFEALLAKRRSESGMADLDTMRNNPNKPSLINHPGDGSTDVVSGVNPASIKTPRHKIAGSADNDPITSLENAQEEESVELASAQVSDESAVNGFRVLASMVIDSNKEETQASQNKPGFDPVH